jgi:hypothetical protein
MRGEEDDIVFHATHLPIIPNIIMLLPHMRAHILHRLPERLEGEPALVLMDEGADHDELNGGDLGECGGVLGVADEGLGIEYRYSS